MLARLYDAEHNAIVSRSDHFVCGDRRGGSDRIANLLLFGRCGDIGGCGNCKSRIRNAVGSLAGPFASLRFRDNDAHARADRFSGTENGVMLTDHLHDGKTVLYH